MTSQPSSDTNTYSVSIPTSFPSRAAIYSCVTTGMTPSTPSSGSANGLTVCTNAATLHSISTSSITLRRVAKDCKYFYLVIGKS